MTIPFIPGKTVEVPDIPFADSVTASARDTAVIVVDMQNDFVKPGGSLVVPAASETLQAIQDLLARARKAGVRIVYTQDTHREGDPEWQIWPEHCRIDNWGWQIVEELAPKAGDLVVQKNRYDGFFETELDYYLARLWKVNHLILVGTVSNICVAHTAASAGLRWYKVVVPADGIAALTEFDQALTLRQVSWLYTGTVARSAADVVFSA